MGRIAYDEFSMFAENIAEYGLAASATPVVSRVTTTLANGRAVSALKWGSEAPRMVLVHGTAQNAHTWDTTILALGLPALAIDLPGHGHSDSAAPFAEGAGPLSQNADDMAMVIRRLAPNAAAVVGMSLGGLTSLALSHRYPDIVQIGRAHV